MIIINLTGGLGNQMFQYAFGRHLSLKNKTELKYHFTSALLNTKRDFELDVFKIQATKAQAKDLERMKIIKNRQLNRFLYLLDERFGLRFNSSVFTERLAYGYKDYMNSIPDDSYIQGYFADQRYFIDIEKVLRNEFTPKKKLDSINEKIVSEMKQVNSVSIHVRRGDYITNKANRHLNTGFSYYKNAIQKINIKVKQPIFYIFSDDIDWCRKKFRGLKNKYFMNHDKGTDSFKDMILMSNCRHNVIANSSFSWWGAWLNDNKNKILIKPS